MAITHKPKAGALLTGTEYEAADSHLGEHAEDHDHDGSPTQKLTQANTHQSPDTDAGASSLHHTLGSGANQSAAGNHSHTGNAPDSADYLVGTAQGGLSAEIVVGTAPGGELGGTWASPTVDATHSGSAHHPAPLIDVSAGSAVSSTSLADTDMAIAVAANTNYRIWAAIFFNTNATTVGIRISFNGPAGATLKVGGFVSTGAAGTNDSTIAQMSITVYDTQFVTTSGPGATNAVAFFSGVLLNGANAGTFTVRHASETATLTSIESGSFLELQQF